MSSPEVAADEAAAYDVLPQDRLRRVTAKRLRAAVPEKPQVTLHSRAIVDRFLAARKQVGALPGSGSASVTVTAALARIVAESLTRMGRLNGHVNGDEVRLFHAVNLGVAVDTGSGLITPVIRDAHTKTVYELAAELENLANKARAGTIHPTDLADPTFTISNLGSYGVEQFTPLVNPPQIAILGVGATLPGVALVDGARVDVLHLGLSLSFDHAAVDGAAAAEYLRSLIELIEAPDDILLSGLGGD